MVAATTSIPELSPRESELLAALIVKKYDFIDLAETYKLQPAQLLAFTLSPAVSAHLSAFKAFGDTLLALRLQETQLKSLDVLEKIATTSESPIESRRAASTILRGPCIPGGLPGGTPLRGARKPGALSRHHFSPENGDAENPALHGEDSIAPSPAHAPSRAAKHSAPLPFGSPREEDCATEPDPALTPETVIHTLTYSLALRTPALLRFLAGSATVNGRPVTAATLHAELSALIPRTKVVQVQTGAHTQSPGPPETFTTHIYLIHDGGRQIRIKTTLTREPTGETHQWLLAALHIGPNTS